MNGNRHNVFLDCDCILKLSLAIEKLPKPGYLVINDLLLGLRLCCENDITIVVTYDRHRALAKCVDVNCESITNVIHNGIYTWPGLPVGASLFQLLFLERIRQPDCMAKAPAVKWTREHRLIALNLYCKLPFGKLHKDNPIIKEVAAKMGRTPSSLAMKLCNFASLDPV